MDAWLPGLEPELIRVTLVKRPDSGWDLSILTAADARYVKAADTTDFEGLTIDEASDVVNATIDGIAP